MKNPYHVKRTRNKLYLLKYCIILTTAGDKSVFHDEDRKKRCLEYMNESYRQSECIDVGSYVLENALVMKFDAPPTLVPTVFANAFKTKSAVLLKEVDELWNTGYFITTIGKEEPETEFFTFYEYLKRRKKK